MRQSDVLERGAPKREILRPGSDATWSAKDRTTPPEEPNAGEAAMVRPLVEQGGPLQDEPATDGSLIRALAYAVPVALGGWALIGAAIWSFL